MFSGTMSEASMTIEERRASNNGAPENIVHLERTEIPGALANR
jgi:hypothetical protein